MARKGRAPEGLYVQFENRECIEIINIYFIYFGRKVCKKNCSGKTILLTIPLNTPRSLWPQESAFICGFKLMAGVLLLSNGLDDGLAGLGEGGAVGVVLVQLRVGGLGFVHVFHAA